MSLVFFHEFGEFNKTRKFSKTHEICELREIHGFCDYCSGTGNTAGHWVVRETVLCIACFAYSVVVVVVVLLLSP